MRTIRTILLVLALAVGAFGPVRGDDSTAGCSGTYTLKAKCGPIVVRGTPISVSGDSTGTRAFVQVSLAIHGYPEVPPVVLCDGTGSGSARCSADYPDAFTTLKVPDGIGTIKVWCHVSGSGSGRYGCHLGPKS